MRMITTEVQNEREAVVRVRIGTVRRHSVSK